MALPDAPAWITAEDYAAFTLEELQDLIAGRLEYFPPELDSKRDCIDALMVADVSDGKRWTGPFRFVDLPPEMRNHVYRELLTIAPATGGDLMTKRGCHPAILGASKQLQKEGSGILYGDNVREVSISAHCDSPGRDEELSTNSIGETTLKVAYFPMSDYGFGWNVGDLFLRFDAHINKFEHLSVKLLLDLSPSAWRTWDTVEYNRDVICRAANRILYCLASKLDSRKMRKSITFNVATISQPDDQGSSAPDIDDDTLQQTLSPISLLGNFQSVTITGISANVQAHVKLNMTTDAWRSAGFLPWSIAQSLRDLTELCARMKTLEHARFAEVEVLMKNMLIAIRTNDLVDANFVARFAAAKQAMETMLADPDATLVNSRWTEWLSKRQSRSKKGKLIKASV